MTQKTVQTAVIGTGMISDIYLKNILNFKNIEVTAVASAHFSHAAEKAKQYGLRAMTVNEVMADPDVELIVNLTPVQSHYEIIKTALLAGKHVYTEKTLTDNPVTTRDLICLARKNHLILASAPDTFIGASLQTARKLIDEGRIGKITSAVVSANRQNDYLLSNYSFLRQPGCGLCYDYGVYYITALVSLLGPINGVSAICDNPIPEHINRNPKSPEYGVCFQCDNESRVCALIQFTQGITATFHLNSNSIRHDQSVFAIYGTEGILYLGNPNKFGDKIHLICNNQEHPERSETIEIPLCFPFRENSRGLGVTDLADAILDHRQPRCNANLASHVLDVLTAILESSKNGRNWTQVNSLCERPDPFY